MIIKLYVALQAGRLPLPTIDNHRGLGNVQL